MDKVIPILTAASVVVLAAYAARATFALTLDRGGRASSGAGVPEGGRAPPALVRRLTWVAAALIGLGLAALTWALGEALAPVRLDGRLLMQVAAVALAVRTAGRLAGVSALAGALAYESGRLLETSSSGLAMILFVLVAGVVVACARTAAGPHPEPRTRRRPSVNADEALPPAARAAPPSYAGTESPPPPRRRPA